MTIFRPVFLIFLLLSASFSQAQEQLEKVSYVAMKPPFVTNFGSGDRLHYMKVEISLRTETIPDSLTVEKHLPYLRNNLVMLLSSQSEEAVNSHEGREQLKKDALIEVQQILEEEEGRKLVTEVLFNNFIVQS